MLGVPSIADHHRLQRRVENAIWTTDPDAALAVYLDPAAASVRKPAVEWALVSLLGQWQLASPPEGLDAWPADRLASPSGAALLFAVTQSVPEDVGSAIPAPGVLGMPAIGGRHKEWLARAWLLRPDRPTLTTEQRRQLSRWLARHPPATGRCLLVAAALEDQTLVDELGPRWLRCGVYHPGAPAEVARVSAVRGLASYAKRALPLVTAACFGDGDALAHLLEPALELGDAESAAVLGEAVFVRGRDPHQRRLGLAVRLAALGLGLHGARLVDEYRRHWQPTGWSYPWPERLLYLFQELGADDEKRHLLAHMEVTGSTPRWVSLVRETTRASTPTRSQMREWEELHVNHPRDERVLVGATRAVLRCQRPELRRWSERLGLRERWSRLAELERYRDLAAAFLVLLHTEEEDRIVEFERRLADTSLDLPVVRWAARSYLAALRRTRQWRRLQEVESRRPEMVQRACPYRERELIRCLARLSRLPGESRERRYWCEVWESLLGLDLEPAEVVEVLDLFVTLSRELEMRGDGGEQEESLLTDVTLQIVRRGRAEAEALLTHRGGRPDDRREVEERLRRAGPDATLRLLQELLSTGPSQDPAAAGQAVH